MRNRLPYFAGLATIGLCWGLAWAMTPSVKTEIERTSFSNVHRTHTPTAPVLRAAIPTDPHTSRSHQLGPLRWDEDQGKYVAALRGREHRLTLVPEVQEKAAEALAKGRPFYGATVVMDAKDGRILAMAEYSQREPERSGVSLRPDAPAASIFKLVSAAALLEENVQPEQSVCVSGGKRRLSPKNLLDRKRDQCVEFRDIVPLSLNAAMAKLTDRRLPPGRLEQMAENLGFGRLLPIEIPMEPSVALIPTDDFGRANAAAGFGEVRMSALHAAIVTALIANRGEWVPPRLFEANDVPVLVEDAPAPRLSPSVAGALARMMTDTTSRGTARRLFSRISRSSPLRNIEVGAKTGSLLFYDRHVDHSWMVAFAPASDPAFVVASVVVNDWQLWYTKAGPLAFGALEAAFSERLGKD